MTKNIVFGAVALLMLVSPVVASAQASAIRAEPSKAFDKLSEISKIPPNASIADLQSIIVRLNSMLQQLLATIGTKANPIFPIERTSPRPTESGLLTATVTEGQAPLTTYFYIYNTPYPATSIDFGDGTSAATNPYALVSCDYWTATCPKEIISHTYTSPGTYTVKLKRDALPTEAACVYSADSYCLVMAWVRVTAMTNPVATSTPILSPRITLGTVGTSTVTAAYYDMPPNSQIVIMNQTSGTRVDGVSTYLSTGGSGSVTIPFPSGMPAGTYYLKAQNYNTQGYIAQTVAFTAQAQTTTIPLPCPLYMQPICSVGQQLVTDPMTYDARGCEVPNRRCVPITSPSVSCTYTPSTDKDWGSKIGSYLYLSYLSTTSLQNSQDACRSWCASQSVERGAQYSCVYGATSISRDASSNVQVASALNAMESILQGILSRFGR